MPRIRSLRRSGRTEPVFALALLLALLPACSDGVFPGEPEEVPTQLEDVPEVVQTAVAGLCAQIGGVTSAAWSWDREDQDWEITLSGMLRQAELDVGTDGAFHELELAYDLAEIEAVLPHVAEFIHKECRDCEGVFIELSLRRQTFLDSIPSLAVAWEQPGAVIEFQCANGRDFEVDAQDRYVTRRLDDPTER